MAAVDLPGHGESGWRENYDLVSWARDVALLIEEERGLHPPIVIGHSMGATVALVLASLRLTTLTGVIAIDSPIGIPHPKDERFSPTQRKYHTRHDAESRFRVLPSDPSTPGFIEKYLARHAVRQLPDVAWTWKTDPMAMTPVLIQVGDLAPVIDTPALIVLAERGLATWEVSRQVSHRFRQPTEIVSIANAGHHILLDQPLMLISLLQQQLLRWTCN